MSKVTMEFNLPEEESEYRQASYGRVYYCALWDIDQRCRGAIKYGNTENSVEEFAEAIRDMMPNLDEIS